MATDRVTVRAVSKGDLQFTTSTGTAWNAPKERCLRSKLFEKLFSSPQALIHRGTELTSDHVKAPKRGGTQEDQNRAPTSVRVYSSLLSMYHCLCGMCSSAVSLW